MSKEEVDEAFAAWAIDARRLSGTGPDTRALIGALGGVRVLTHLCERSVNRDTDVVDDALVSLNHLSVDDEAVEDLVCLGGLQVLADLLIDEEMPIKVHSHAAQLIPKVLLNDELRLAFLDLGVVPSLVRLLKVSRCCPPRAAHPTTTARLVATVSRARGQRRRLLTPSLSRGQVKNQTLVVRVLVVVLSLCQTDACCAHFRSLGYPAAPPARHPRTPAQVPRAHTHPARAP